MGKFFDTYVSRFLGLVALIGFIVALTPAGLAYFHDASAIERGVILVGVGLMVTAGVLELRKLWFVSTTEALRDANGRVTTFLRARAARAGGNPAVPADEDWLRTHHGDAEYQGETLALYYDALQRVVLDALDRPRVKKHLTLDQRRFAQQPRSVDDIWATAELLSATNRAIQGITDPAYDGPYAYEDRR
jgi:hypothetical protein